LKHQQSQLNRGLSSRKRKIENKEVLKLDNIPKIDNQSLAQVSSNVSSAVSSKKKKNKLQLSDAWDKLEVFTKMAREKLIRQKVTGKVFPTKLEFVIFFISL